MTKLIINKLCGKKIEIDFTELTYDKSENPEVAAFVVMCCLKIKSIEGSLYKAGSENPLSVKDRCSSSGRYFLLESLGYHFDQINQKTELASVNLRNAKFKHDSFENANFSHAQLDGAHFVECDFKNANFFNANVSYCFFEHCWLDGANFQSVKGLNNVKAPEYCMSVCVGP